MWTVDATRYSLSQNALLHAGDLLDVQTWPVVLDLAPSYRTADEIGPARQAAEAELRAARLIADDGELVDGLAAVLHVLSRPEVELEVRIVDASGMRRMCIARRGRHHVRALRFGDNTIVESIEVTDAGQLGNAVLDVLDAGDAASFTGISAARDELAERLNECRGVDDFAQALHAVGASHPDAAAVSAAFADVTSQCEVVAVEHQPGTTHQTPGAVAIYATGRGRIVASPSTSADGRIWTTISPGTRRRIEQAIGLLLEFLPGGRWMP